MPNRFDHLVLFNTALNLNVTHLLVALGSNDDPKKNLPTAIQQLKALGHIQLSDDFVNPDFTATKSNSKPDYTNQCAIIKLDMPSTLQQVVKTLKQIELDCFRDKTLTTNDKTSQKIRLVSMDIDVLAIRSVNSAHWQAIKKRYPFKEHEWVGIKQLLS